MNIALPIAPASADADQLLQIRRYLTHRQYGQSPCKELEKAWTNFYKQYSRKIRTFAFTCGTSAEDIADCAQEVWRELLVRLPVFHPDQRRGQFETWLFTIVQS